VHFAVHDPLDPEFSILKQRLARRLRHGGADEAALQRMALVDLTKVRGCMPGMSELLMEPVP